MRQYNPDTQVVFDKSEYEKFKTVAIENTAKANAYKRKLDKITNELAGVFKDLEPILPKQGQKPDVAKVINIVMSDPKILSSAFNKLQMLPLILKEAEVESQAKTD